MTEQTAAELSAFLPSRYGSLKPLGTGGGGAVFSATDQASGRSVALKVLHQAHAEEDREALIDEAITISALEGIGTPLIREIGRLADGRLYVVRDLVEGDSYAVYCEQQPRQALALLAMVAAALGKLHQAGILHGDIKPQNIVIEAQGTVRFVDFGMSQTLSAGSKEAIGFTPHYAAPETMSRGELSASSEVYSLGVILADLLKNGTGAAWSQAQELQLNGVAQRAMRRSMEERFPSAGEFEHALRLCLGTDIPDAENDAGLIWQIQELDQWVYSLDEVLRKRETSEEPFLLNVCAAGGAGYSTLVRRYCWARSLQGREVILIDHPAVLLSLLRGAQESAKAPTSLQVLVIDVPVTDEFIARLSELLLLPAFKSVGVVALEQVGSLLRLNQTPIAASTWALPNLSSQAAFRLVDQALEGFPSELWGELSSRVPLLPGALREFCLLAQELPIAAVADVEEILGNQAEDQASQGLLLKIEFALERGRYALASQLLIHLPEVSPRELLAHARYELSTGSPVKVLSLCERGILENSDSKFALEALAARAEMGLGDYQKALERLGDVKEFPPLQQSEALAYRGLACALLGQFDAGTADLERALALAQQLKQSRLIALAAASLGTAQWRAKEHQSAEESYQIALKASVQGGEAGLLSSTLVNLAGLLKEQGQLAEAAQLLQRGVSAARKSGRVASLRQALLNLANLDLYLGRVERVRYQLMRAKGLGFLLPVQEAQWVGLHSELLRSDEQYAASLASFRDCASKWRALSRKREAAEALLEAAVMATSVPKASERDTSSFVPSTPVLEEILREAAELLGDQKTPLYHLALAHCEFIWQRYDLAEKGAEQALSQALNEDDREWAWRAYLLLSEIADASSQGTRGTRCAQQGLELLEEIGARLPVEIAPAFWNEPRRAALKARAYGEARRDSGRSLSERSSESWAEQQAFVKSEDSAIKAVHSEFRPETASKHSLVGTGTDLVSRLSRTPLERRLSRILEINHDLAFEHDFQRLALRILAHASELLAAERALLLLGASPQKLETVAVRGPRDQVSYSHSIASQVLESGEAFVSIDAASDPRLKSADSIQLTMISAVVCVAVASTEGTPQGVLYLETRKGVRSDFATELPILQAFADQAAIALERARLVNELESKSQDLAEKSSALEQQAQVLSIAKERLSELLGEKTASLQAAQDTIRRTTAQLKAHTQFSGIVGSSPAMLRIFELIQRLREREIPVLITGESGTGKEIVARAIHQDSPRDSKPMLAINCGAVPESILESELFGHRRGAFTGATHDRAGLFEQADGGVLFLDEVGETPLKMQASLLRVLQDSKIRPIGGQREKKVNVRLVFATNRDLEHAVALGKFREDLLYRIQVVQLHLPPLRERREDIPLLIDHFLERYSVRFDQSKKQLTQEARRYLVHHPLPGNVRQLENMLLSAWVLSEGKSIQAADLGDETVVVSAFNAPNNVHDKRQVEPLGTAANRESKPKAPKVKGRLNSEQQRERAAILGALKQAEWNRVKAAKIVGMPRRTFYRRLKQYEIQ